MLELAKEMNSVRTKYGEILSKKINKELKELEMKNARFNIKIEFQNDNKFNSNGLDKVEFVISTNVGDEEKSLIKIASGGEMSRIMLAIKSVLAEVDKIPVIIFDEIDTGISGIAANATGEKMKKISKTHQVLCVTHLASIAAKGEYNYFVSKKVENETTKTSIKQLLYCPCHRFSLLHLKGILKFLNLYLLNLLVLQIHQKILLYHLLLHLIYHHQL